MLMLAFQTMKVIGYVKKKPLQILIDSRSTHNFLDLTVRKQVGSRLIHTQPLQVSVADGSKISSSNICKELVWKIQDVNFQADVMVLPLGGSEMMLGVQQLSPWGSITRDFQQLRMQLFIKGKRHVLKGSTAAAVKSSGENTEIKR
jgi:hypothetical protein